MIDNAICLYLPTTQTKSPHRFEEFVGSILFGLFTNVCQ